MLENVIDGGMLTAVAPVQWHWLTGMHVELVALPASSPGRRLKRTESTWSNMIIRRINIRPRSW